MEELDCFRYLGVDHSSMQEWKHIVGEGRLVAGALKNVWKRRKVTIEAKMGMYYGIIDQCILGE